MSVQFDPGKAVANLRTHGVSFEEAEAVLFDPLAVTIEDPDAVGEQRFVRIGRGASGHLVVIVYTERGDAFRLISARRPTRKERKSYEG